MIQTEQIQNIYWKWLVHDGEPDILLEKRVWIEGHSLKDILDDLDILKNHATTTDDYDSIPDVIKLRKMLPSRECFIDALMELAQRHVIHGRLTSDHIIVDINPHFGEPQINIISWTHVWNIGQISFERWYIHKQNILPCGFFSNINEWHFAILNTDLNCMNYLLEQLEYEPLREERDIYKQFLLKDGECQY
jgi:hypothetical protein